MFHLAASWFMPDWEDTRNQALTRYFRIFHKGHCTVEQWNDAVTRYGSIGEFNGAGSLKMRETLYYSEKEGLGRFAKEDKNYRTTSKRLVAFSEVRNFHRDVSWCRGRVFTYGQIRARIQRFQEYLSLKSQRDILEHRRKARRFLKAAQDASSPAQLYRHFAADGTLLYVGISNNHVNRLSAHRTDSAWFPLIASITIEHFPTRADAERAEVAAILRERPIFNRQHNPLSLAA
jgi:hypothetical protein